MTNSPVSQHSFIYEHIVVLKKYNRSSKLDFLHSCSVQYYTGLGLYDARKEQFIRGRLNTRRKLLV